MDKQSLRNRIQRLRGQLTEEERQRFSLEICRQVSAISQYQRAKTILYFMSFRSEVETRPLILEGLAQQKKVILPLTDIDQQKLSFSELRNLATELQIGAYGICEPKAEYIRTVSAREIDLVLTPGLVFDETGYRIGYGGGYYDRFLGSLRKKPFLIALAFELQVLHTPLPVEEFDIPVDLIVTERRVILCQEKREKGDGNGFIQFTR